MPTKLNVSVPKMRTVSPPCPLKERRDTFWRTPWKIETQVKDPSPLAKYFTNFRMPADPEIIQRESPLYAPGRGKPAGSKRELALRKPPYDE